MKAEWYFPKLMGGQANGLTNTAISNFKSDDAVARETVQNVLDNKAVGDTGEPKVDVPAEVEFEVIDVPREKFPGIDQLSESLKFCKQMELDGVNDPEGGVERFFDQAEKVLNGDSMRVLRIRDRNTTGLVGNDTDRKHAFARLIRHRGGSKLEGVGGGNHGIGQGAPFSDSDLRTVIYFTRTKNDVGFVGKSILCTHKDENGNQLQDTGFFANVNESRDNWASVRIEAEIDPFFLRDDVGTDIYITGFNKHGEDWSQIYRDAILCNYFNAIRLGELVCSFKADGKELLRVDEGNLFEVVAKAADEEKDRLSNDREAKRPLRDTYHFLDALRNPANNKPFTDSIDGIGEVSLYVKVDPEDETLPDEWSFQRQPHMKVGCRSNTVLRRFAGVFVCDNDVGNKLLSSFEDEKHDSWKEENLRNPSQEQKKECRRVLRKISEFVRDSLRSLRPGSQADECDLQGLGAYCPDVEPGQNSLAGGQGSGTSNRLGNQVNGTPSAKRAKKPKIKRLASRPAKARPRPKQAGTLNVNALGQPGGPTAPPKLPGGGGGGGQQGTTTPIQGKKNKKVRIIKAEEIAWRSYVDSQNPDESVFVVRGQGHERITGELQLSGVGEQGVTIEPTVIAATLADGTPLKHNGNSIRGITVPKTGSVNIRIKTDLGPRVCLQVK